MKDFLSSGEAGGDRVGKRVLVVPATQRMRQTSACMCESEPQHDFKNKTK